MHACLLYNTSMLYSFMPTCQARPDRKSDRALIMKHLPSGVEGLCTLFTGYPPFNLLKQG
jgi:hypothetical protein